MDKKALRGLYMFYHEGTKYDTKIINKMRQNMPIVVSSVRLAYETANLCIARNTKSSHWRNYIAEDTMNVLRKKRLAFSNTRRF